MLRSLEISVKHFAATSRARTHALKRNAGWASFATHQDRQAAGGQSTDKRAPDHSLKNFAENAGFWTVKKSKRQTTFATQLTTI